MSEPLGINLAFATIAVPVVGLTNTTRSHGKLSKKIKNAKNKNGRSQCH